jgi:general secretion pathway protein E
VIRLVNSILFEAVRRGASDVHVQGYEDALKIRFRVDGMLFDIYSPPKALQAEIVSRIKVMGGMDIAEQRLAQDARATVEVGDRVVDLRISTLPTNFGERAVIRLLDKSARLYELTELGMPADVLERFRELSRTDRHCDVCRRRWRREQLRRGTGRDARRRRDCGPRVWRRFARWPSRSPTPRARESHN